MLCVFPCWGLDSVWLTGHLFPCQDEPISQSGRQAGLLSLKGPLRTNGCSSPFSAPVCFAVHVSVCHVSVPVRAEPHRAEGAVGPSELKLQGEHCLSLNVLGTRPGASGGVACALNRYFENLVQ